MTLQAKLTLGSVLLATLIVTLVSAVDLGNLMQFQFNTTLERAELIKSFATETVKDELKRAHPKPWREALHDKDLHEKLLKLLTQASIIEIALVATEQQEVVTSTNDAHVGLPAAAYPDFEPLVKKAGWLEKVRILMKKEPVYY